ncbi:MAG: hypothetical protein RIQ81_241 [Pseudomonadota bacterium]
MEPGAVSDLDVPGVAESVPDEQQFITGHYRKLRRRDFRRPCRLFGHWITFFPLVPGLRETNRAMENPGSWSTGADEETTVTTRDGWVLPIYRFRPGPLRAPAKPPIVLCHGLGANRFNLAPGYRTSLARWLASRGRDVCVVELRGAGRSVDLTPDANRSAAWRYNFDSYVQEDVPALLAGVRQLTGHDEVDWVGHSMGATILYALAGHHRGQVGGVGIRKGVAIAGPGRISGLPPRLRMMLELCTRLPLHRLPNRAWLAVLGLLFPLLTPRNEPSLGFKSNYELGFAKQLIRHIGADISRDLLRQVKSWAGRDGIYSACGSINYTSALAQSPVPLRFIRASHDMLVPASAVDAAWRAAGGWKDLVIIGKAHGHRSDYGHSDIVLGMHVEHDVYPHIHEWLELDQSEIPAPKRALIFDISSDTKLNPSSKEIPGLTSNASGQVAAAR